MATRLQKCCCFSAQTGAKIIAVFSLVSWTVFAIVCIFILGILPVVEEAQDSRFENYNELVKILAKNWKNQVQSMYIVFGICFVMSMTNIATTSSLLYGIRKRQQKYMVPWLFLTFIGLVFLAIFAFVRSFILCGTVNGSGLLALPFQAAGIGIGCYLWAVIDSVYQDIKDESEGVAKIPNEPIKTIGSY